MKRGIVVSFLVVLIYAVSLIGTAQALTIDFETLTDSESVTTQYAGVTFSNATVLTAGISLNELEFPPHSGTNVVFDDGGPMSLAFSSPMSDFDAYFTYAEPLTLSFYNSSNALEGTDTSAFSSNTALSGDPGSSPNELLGFASAQGFSKVVIAGDPAGGSFVMDDVTATPVPAVPEPGTLVLLGTGLIGMARFASKKRETKS